MNESSTSARSVRIGLAAIAATWLTGPVSIPIVKMLRPNFSAEELLFVRSLFGLICSYAIAREKVWKTGWRIRLAGVIMASSSLGFYRAVQAWDINPIMVIIAILPVVNIIIAWIEGRKISPIVYVSFAFLMYGIVTALDPWNQPINTVGLSWALFCVVGGAIGCELWGKASLDTTISEKCFWFAVPLLVATPIIVLCTQLPLRIEKYYDSRSLWLLFVLGAVNGIVYMYATIAPFSRVGKMNTVTATVLLQVATPCTIIGAYYLTGEVLNSSQWVGVFIALFGATILSVWLTNSSKANSS